MNQCLIYFRLVLYLTFVTYDWCCWRVNGGWTDGGYVRFVTLLTSPSNVTLLTSTCSNLTVGWFPWTVSTFLITFASIPSSLAHYKYQRSNHWHWGAHLIIILLVCSLAPPPWSEHRAVHYPGAGRAGMETTHYRLPMQIECVEETKWGTYELYRLWI